MQQLTYKGKNLDEIMTRIANRHGESVRIVAVNRSRTGGILGFFQREEHVLVAEFDDAAPPTEPPNPERESLDLGHELPEHEMVFAVQSATSLQSLIPRHELHGGIDDPRLDGEDGSGYGPHDLTQATLQTSDGLQVINRAPARSVEEFLMSQAEETEDVFEITTTPRPPKSFDEALESVTGSLGHPPEPVAQVLLDPTMHWADAVLAGSGVERLETGVEADDPSGKNALMRRLRRAGYPARMLAELASLGIAEATLHRAFSIVPEARALPGTRGGLIAIVGPEKRATELAIRLASELDGNNTTLALVTQRPAPITPPLGTRFDVASGKHSKQRPKDASAFEGGSRHPSESHFESGYIARNLDEVADLAGGWRRDRIGVVAVSCDMQVASYPWVRSMLQALAPNYVGLVARATTKPRDLDMIATLIGGADSLMVEGLNETLTPLSALDSVIPVSRLDGQTASTAAWMSAFESIPPCDPEV